MQKMDPHTLFSIFEQGDEQIYKEHGLEDTLDNPFVLMGMVVRGLDNYHLMDQMYMRQYPKRYKQVRRLTKYKYFNKLFGYLTRIDSTNFDQFYKIGESFDKSHVFNVLDYLRLYYEDIEEYEKCAIVKRYIDLLQTYGKEQVMDFRM
jgi:hypothetical protein